MPVEMWPVIQQAFKDWREKWRPKMEMFEFFAAGTGGWGVLNTTDEKELSQIMLEYPLTLFSVVEVLPTVNGDELMDRMTEVMNQWMAAMKPS